MPCMKFCTLTPVRKGHPALAFLLQDCCCAEKHTNDKRSGCWVTFDLVACPVPKSKGALSYHTIWMFLPLHFTPDSRATNVCKWCLLFILPCATSLRFQSPAFLLRSGNGTACWCVPVEDVTVFFWICAMVDHPCRVSGLRAASFFCYQLPCHMHMVG